jgi:hypothetical protein
VIVECTQRWTMRFTSSRNYATVFKIKMLLLLLLVLLLLLLLLLLHEGSVSSANVVCRYAYIFSTSCLSILSPSDPVLFIL